MLYCFMIVEGLKWPKWKHFKSSGTIYGILQKKGGLEKRRASKGWSGNKVTCVNSILLPNFAISSSNSHRTGPLSSEVWRDSVFRFPFRFSIFFVFRIQFYPQKQNPKSLSLSLYVSVSLLTLPLPPPTLFSKSQNPRNHKSSRAWLPTLSTQSGLFDDKSPHVFNLPRELHLIDCFDRFRAAVSVLFPPISQSSGNVQLRRICCQSGPLRQPFLQPASCPEAPAASPAPAAAEAEDGEERSCTSRLA